jgi:hypothetical protein
MLYNSEGGSAKTNLCARNAPLLLDINFLGVKDESNKLKLHAKYKYDVLSEFACMEIPTIRVRHYFRIHLRNSNFTLQGSS